MKAAVGTGGRMLVAASRRRADVFAASAVARRRGAVSPQAAYALKFAVVHEGEEARRWAARVIRRVAEVIGENSVQAGWWRIQELNNLASLSGAVREAAAAG